MDHIWVTEMVLKPAGPLTFRRMPSGSLPIMSYPFMPPTTMSGFLRRLLMIAEGGEWPGYGEDWYGTAAIPGAGEDPQSGKSGKKKTNRKRGKDPDAPGREFTLTLEKEYRALGAFPPAGCHTMHTTRRHGPKDFKHHEFSKILRVKQEESEEGEEKKAKKPKGDYQLHYWDYLFCDEMTGWVAAAERGPVERLSVLKGYGGKAGKEGYVYVAGVGPPKRLSLARGDFRPAGLVPTPLRPATGTFYTLYGHHWDDGYLWTNGERGGVVGYYRQGAWWTVEHLAGPYWALEDGYGIPAGAPDAFLKGDVEPLCGGNSL